MLGKLYKHEFKATSIQMLPLIAIVLIASLFNKVVFNYEKNSQYSYDMEGSMPIAIVRIFQFVTIAAIVAFMMVVFIILVTRFSKRMTGDQAYLNLTLPVSSWEHILVNSTVSSFWMILSSVITVFASLLMVPEENVFSELVTGFIEGINQFSMEANIPVTILILEIVLLVIITPIAYFSLIYLAIGIGQLWTGHSKLGTFLAVIGFYIANAIISRIGAFVIVASGNDYSLSSMFFYNANGATLNTMLLFNIIYYIAVGAIAFAGSSYIFEKKINLQ